MANGSKSQVQFKFQRPANQIYRVGPGLLFTTIQAAITQAVADGFTASTNPALVEVYDKGSAYVEDLALSPGVFLKGIVDRDQKIAVQGQATYNPGNATQAQNTLYIAGISLQGTGGAAPTLLISGAALPLDVRLVDSQVQRLAINDGQSCIKVTNTNATANNVRVRVIDSQIQIDDSTATAYAVDMLRGRCDLHGGRTIVQGTTSETLFILRNNAQLNSFYAAAGNTIQAVGAYVIEIAGAAATVNVNGVFITNNTFANGSFINFSAAGTATIRHCSIFLQSATSVFTNGAGTLTSSNNNILNNSLSTTTTLNENAQNRRSPNGNRKIYRVGNGNYSTIQLAITDAEAIGGTAEIRVAPGTYAESPNVTANGISIVADTLDPLTHQNFVTRITGVLTYTPAIASPLGLEITNIAFSSASAVNSCVVLNGANSAKVAFNNCIFQNTTGTSAPLVNHTNANIDMIFINCFAQSDNGSSSLIFMTGGTHLISGNEAANFVCWLRNVAAVKAPLFKLTATASLTILGSACTNQNGAVAEFADTSVLILNYSTTFANTPTFDAESFLFSGATSEVDVQESTINTGTQDVSGNNVRSLVARSGTQATDTATVTVNVFTGGVDKVTVQGEDFVNGVDWATGGSLTITAANIAAAINASLNAAINNIIYATSSGAVVTVHARKPGAAGNAFTFSTNTANITVATATFTGGVTGGVNNVVKYGGSFPGEFHYDNNISAAKYVDTLVGL